MLNTKVLALLLAGLFNQTASASVDAVNPLLEFASQSYLNGSLKLTAQQHKDMECLTKVIWFEARGESKVGKRLVTDVVRNRVKYGKPFEQTLCKVVYQPNQFAWTKNKNKKKDNFKRIASVNMKTEKKQVLDTVEVALSAVVLQVDTKSEATHFCSAGEKCNFKNVKRLGKVGNHTIFKYLGNPS